MKKHAKFSASSSKRWINCPGSVNLCAVVPPLPDTDFSKEGTEAHEVLEIFLLNRHRDLKQVKAALLKKWPAKVEMIEHGFNSALAIKNRLNPESILFIESKVDLSFIEPDTFGTLDCAILDGKHLSIIDYKYGAGIEVETVSDTGEINSQLAFYALGLMHYINRELGRDIETVSICVIQPRVENDLGELIRESKVEAKEILEFEKIFKMSIAMSKTKDAILSAGEWCRFCAAASICPEISKNKLKEAQVVFKDDFSEISFPDPLALTPDHISKVLKVAPQIEFWLKEVKKRSISMLNLGEKIPDFKLVQKRGRRQWVDVMAVVDYFKKENLNELIEVKPKSPAQVEKFDKAMKEFVRSNAAMVSSGVTIAAESDKREAVSNAALSFDEWEENE